MKNGFELLKTRQKNGNINFELLEITYNIKIPPIYRSFLNMFCVDEEGIFKDTIFIENQNFNFNYCRIESSYNPDIIVTDFIDIEKSLKLRANSYNTEDVVIQKGYIPFATTSWSLTLHIGTRGEETDMVILEYDSAEGESMGINVFEFIQSLVLYEIKDEDMPFGIKKSDIYKNWGEDFWRVR